MKYRTATAFRAALEAHIAAHARQATLPTSRVRKAVMFERLLARLAIVAPDSWLLKGALALNIRFGAAARATNDMDLARADDIESATTELLSAASYDAGDYFRFIVRQTDKLSTLEDAVAVRYHVRADLADRRFEEAVLDIGFVPRVHWRTEPLQLPNMLAFAGFPAISVPVLPLAGHVAEKLHAYTREYSGGRVSTREKDLVDLVLIAALHAFDGAALRTVLEETFMVRGIQPLPASVPPPPPGWGVGYRKLATFVGIDPDLAHGHARVAAFLDPVLATESFAGHWDHATQRWSVREEGEAPNGALDG